MNNSSRKS